MIEKNSEILVHNFTEQKISKMFLIKTVRKILNILHKRINSLALVLILPAEIKKLNYYWRGINKATTVLTFSEGDIFLCPEEIKKQAFKRKIFQKKFYQLLLVHSILHLFGYTHDGKTDVKRMECLEAKVLNSLEKLEI
ncbi:MAG: rRNA maturation RNase YbeY [Candidatus Paceibacterota bacterium]|jgi:probable rRNA maturation factor